MLLIEVEKLWFSALCVVYNLCLWCSSVYWEYFTRNNCDYLGYTLPWVVTWHWAIYSVAFTQGEVRFRDYCLCYRASNCVGIWMLFSCLYFQTLLFFIGELENNLFFWWWISFLNMKKKIALLTNNPLWAVDL